MLVSAIRRRLLRWLLRGIEEAGEQINSACRARSAMGGLTGGHEEVVGDDDIGLLRDHGHQRPAAPRDAALSPAEHHVAAALSILEAAPVAVRVLADLAGKVDPGALDLLNEEGMVMHNPMIRRSVVIVNAFAPNDTTVRRSHPDSMTDRTRKARSEWRIEAQAKMGLRLFDLREALGLTQTEFGNIIGVSADTVSAWERGDNMMTSQAILLIQERLGIDPAYFYNGALGRIEHDLAERIKAVRVSREAGEIIGPGRRRRKTAPT